MSNFTLDERERFVTFREAARRTGVSLRQLYAAKARGELPIYQLGGWPRVRWGHLLAWIESRREGAALPPTG